MICLFSIDSQKQTRNTMDPQPKRRIYIIFLYLVDSVDIKILIGPVYLRCNLSYSEVWENKVNFAVLEKEDSDSQILVEWHMGMNLIASKPSLPLSTNV